MGKSLIIKGADFSANGIHVINIPVGTYTTSADVNLAFKRIFIDASAFPNFWDEYYIGVWTARSNGVGVRMRRKSDNQLTDYALWSTNEAEISKGVVSGTLGNIFYYYEVDLAHPIKLEDSAASAVKLTADATNPLYDPRKED